ncbi:MAG: tetratricopeptide repeat protein, partial [Gammaproteobacteria bacterium]
MAGASSCGRLFISYSRRNKVQVYPLADALAKTGIDIWIDREEIDPLDDFPARIRDGLARSHALLAWYSPEYAHSSYCQKELTAAWICTPRLTRDALSRILIVNPEEGVAHIALGDVGRQNYLAAPKDASLGTFSQSIRDKLAGLSGDFAALHEFKRPDWHPASQPGSSRFVGRLRELWCIHTALNPVGISDHENPSVMVQLTGLGGIGKSLLAIEYAKRFGAAYPGGIHWLRAYGFDPQKPVDSEAQECERRHQIEDLALLHDISIRDKEFREVRRDLGKKLAAGEPYLWIVDDLSPGLDQTQGFPGWCAPSGNGHTLITTRSKEYAGLGITVEIDVLDPAAALELLTQKRKPQTKQERQDAEGLAEDLGRHALALDVAGHFLLEYKGFAALRGELASVQSDLLGKISAGLEGQLPGGHEKSIVATLLQSVRLLKREGLNLLRLACELQGGTPIPFRLADKTCGHAFALDQQSAENYRRRAMNQLKIHSLGTISLGGVGDDALSVHALVRYTLLHGDPAQEEATLLRQKLRESALLALVDLLPGVTDTRNHASLELEVDHARHLALEPRTQAEAALSTWLAHFAGERGNYREALAVARKRLPIFTRVLGADHPETLITRGNIATWTGQAGEAREALRLFRELLPDQMRVLGADHLGTLATRSNIANWTGQAGEALRLSRELLPDRTRVLGADHPETLRTRNNIAYWTGLTGEAREALRLFRELLPDRMRVLGADHPETLINRNNIAYWTGQAGEAREALRLFRELLPDQMRVLGADHPNTIHAREWI